MLTVLKPVLSTKQGTIIFFWIKLGFVKSEFFFFFKPDFLVLSFHYHPFRCNSAFFVSMGKLYGNR